MAMDYKTKQEAFWAGTFGTDYIERNGSEGLLAANLCMFSRLLRRSSSITSVLEFGANIGMNLVALNLILPQCETSGIEINPQAAESLRNVVRRGKVYCQSILDFEVDYQRDFVFTKGVLIHICPDDLGSVYQKIYDASSKYIGVAEYYNPRPVEVPYRGHSGFLFKRDFAGELLDKFSDLRLIDYGFSYHRDSLFPQDDITWFLMEKSLAD